MLYFEDEAGNPVQPGILVTISSGGVSQSGYTIAGGAVPGLTLTASATYTATFYAQRGPTAPLSFAAAASGDTTVVITGYRSPYLSTSGAQQLQAEHFPLDRAAPNAPNTFALQTGIGAGAAALDTQTQQAHGAVRLVSSSGAAIDSWALDFFGPTVMLRATGESDTAYLNRILAWLLIPFGTIYGLQLAINMYLTAYVTGGTISGTQAADEEGATDSVGGLDGRSQSARVVTPSVVVFDCMSNPALAKVVGLVAADAQFCVFFVYPNAPGSPPGWELGESEIDVNAFLGGAAAVSIVGPPTPGFGRIVNLVKPGGSEPVYASNQAPT